MDVAIMVATGIGALFMFGVTTQLAVYTGFAIVGSLIIISGSESNRSVKTFFAASAVGIFLGTILSGTLTGYLGWICFKTAVQLCI